MISSNIRDHYSQYFRSHCDEYILKKVLYCFDMKEVCYYTRLSKLHCDEEEIKNRMIELIPDLSMYYRPFRIEALFVRTHLTFRNCITILRNVISHFNYILIRKEYRIDNNKHSYLQIQPEKYYTRRGYHHNISINRGVSMLIDFK